MPFTDGTAFFGTAVWGSAQGHFNMRTGGARHRPALPPEPHLPPGDQLSVVLNLQPLKNGLLFIGRFKRGKSC